jgi:hypothetical protein
VPDGENPAPKAPSGVRSPRNIHKA